MELRLTEKRNLEGKTVELYELGRYTVKVIRFDYGATLVEIRKERAEYLPEIYVRDSDEMKVLGFEIQTTSYGAISVEETKQMIAGLNEAIEAVEILNKEFVR